MRKLRPPLIVFGAIFAFAWVAAILVFAVDPFAIFPWHGRSDLGRSEYNSFATPDLLEATIKDPTVDLVLVGGSNATWFTRAQLNHYLSAANAMNLSYGAPRPLDRALMLDRIAREGRFKRVIVMLDWIYGLSPTRMHATFPFYLYNDSLTDKIRMVGADTVYLSLQRLAGIPLHWRRWMHRQSRTDQDDTPRIRGAPHTIKFLRHIAEEIRGHRWEVRAPTGLTCADFAAVDRQLLPEVRLLSARHIPVDIVVPTLSLAAYYEPPEHNYHFMNRQLAMLRCAVNALDGLAGVRIFGFDDEVWLTEDLMYYKDVTHLRHPKALALQLGTIARGSHRLTKENVTTYAAGLRDRILNYTVWDSSVPEFSHHGS